MSKIDKKKFDNLKELVETAKAKDSELTGQMKQLNRMIQKEFDVSDTDELKGLLDKMQTELGHLQTTFETAQDEVEQMLEELE